MGTNFYFISKNDHIDIHIGKRSAAGMFCWDCGLSLNAGGHECVHQSNSYILDQCAVCGLPAKQERLESSSAGRELGFNKSKPKPKVGISSCASFTWAISPGRFFDLRNSKNLHIEDEYKQQYTPNEFSGVLSECPIKFFGSIGQEFF